MDEAQREGEGESISVAVLHHRNNKPRKWSLRRRWCEEKYQHFPPAALELHSNVSLRWLLFMRQLKIILQATIKRSPSRWASWTPSPTNYDNWPEITMLQHLVLTKNH